MYNRSTLTLLLGAVLLLTTKGSTTDGSQDFHQLMTPTAHVPRKLTTCGTGKYRTSTQTCNGFNAIGICFAGYSTVVSCKSCAAGKYSTGCTSNCACKDCTAGQYAAGTQNSACTACVPGKSAANDGSGACSDCSAGRYQDQSSQTDCIDCAAGKSEANTASLACTDCATGQHQDGTGQAACKDCATGKYAEVTGLEECKACPKGYFEPSTAEDVGCDACPTGYFQKDTTQAKCEDCIVGRYNPVNASASCTRCAAGKAHAQTTQIEATACVNCPAGYYSHDDIPSDTAEHATDTAGQHGTCLECPTGQYQSKEGQITCTDCDWGKYNENTAGPTAESCKRCQAGRYSEQDRSTGMIDTAPGGAGTVPSDHDGLKECIVCPKGYYQPEQGQHICLATEPGHFTKTDESTSQTKCSAGHFNTKKGCQDCVGLTSGDSASNITCLDSTTCDDTAQDKNGIYNRGTETCIGLATASVNEGDCPVAHYQPAEGQTSCIASAAGKYATESAIIAHQELHTDDTHKHHQAQTAEKLCPAGKYNWQDGAGRNTHDGTTSVNGESVGDWKNHYGISDHTDECIECPTGKYQPDEGQTSCLITKPGEYQSAVGQTSAICTKAGFYQPQSEAPIATGGLLGPLHNPGLLGVLASTDPRYRGHSTDHNVQKSVYGPIGRASTDEVLCAPGYVSSPCMAYCSPDPALICAYGFGVPAGLVVLLFIVEELLRKCKRKSVLRTPQCEYMTLRADDDEKGLKKGERVLKSMNLGMLVWSAIPQKNLLRPYLGNLRKKCGIITSRDPPDFNVIPPQPTDTGLKQMLTHLMNKHELLYIFATPKGCKFWALRRLVVMLFQVFFVIGVNIVLYFATGAAHPDCLSPETYLEKFGSEQICNIEGNCECETIFADPTVRALLASVIILPLTALAKWGLADLGPMYPRGNDPKRGRLEYYSRYWGMIQLTMGMFVACTVLLNLATAEGEVELINSALVAIPITWAVGLVTSASIYVTMTRMFFKKPDPEYTKLQKWHNLQAGGKIEPAKPLTLKQFFSSLCACAGAQVEPIMMNDMVNDMPDPEAADVDANETENGAFEKLSPEIRDVLTGFVGKWMTPALMAVMQSIAEGDKPGARENFGKYILSLADLPEKVVDYCTPLIIAAATGDEQAAKKAVGTVVTSELNEQLSIEATCGAGGKHVLDVAVWTVADEAELKQEALVALLETQLSQDPFNAPEPVVKLVVAGTTDGAEGVKAELGAFVAASLEASGVPEIVHPTIVAAVAGDESGVKEALKEAMIETVKQQLESQEDIPATVHPMILCAVQGDADGAKQAAEALTKSELEAAGVPSEIIELVEAAVAGTFEDKAKAMAKDFATKKLTEQGVPDAFVTLILAGAEGDPNTAKETAITLIADALKEKNVHQTIIDLVSAGLSQDSAKVEEKCIDLLVDDLLLGQMNMPEALAPLMKAVAGRSKEDAEKAAVALVTEQLKPKIKEEVPECDGQVANIIVCAILKDKAGAKAAMVHIASSELEDQAPPVVLDVIRFLVANQDKIREWVTALARRHKNSQEPLKQDAPISPTKALPRNEK